MMSSTKVNQQIIQARKERDEYAEGLSFAREALYAKIKEFSIVKRIGDALKSDMSLRSICDEIVSIIIDETSAENCSLWLVDNDAKQVRLTAVKGQQDEK